MYAVIRTGGKQYRVKEGDSLSVEKLGVEKGGIYDFPEVLLLEGEGGVTVGSPLIPNARVRAEVVDNYQDKKVLIFKKKRRKQYRRTRGHRQELTLVRIERIIPDIQAAPAEETPPAPVPEKKPLPETLVQKPAVKAEMPARPAPPRPKKAAEPKAKAKAAPAKKPTPKVAPKAKKAAKE